MNLLMCAPLMDSRGILRYFIGAQIDVTGLVKDGTDLEALQRMRQKQESDETEGEPKDEFQELSRMFNNAELETVRKHGGNMHRELVEDQDDASIMQHRPRVLIQDQSTFENVEEGQKLTPKLEGRLSGPYKHVSLTQSSTQPKNLTNHRNSISSSVLHRRSASCSLPHLFVFQASFSRTSWIALEAATVFAHQLAMLSPTVRAA
jgi:hypothetical protein